jgi:hypothetical protein
LDAAEDALAGCAVRGRGKGGGRGGLVAHGRRV